MIELSERGYFALCVCWGVGVFWFFWWYGCAPLFLFFIRYPVSRRSGVPVRLSHRMLKSLRK